MRITPFILGITLLLFGASCSRQLYSWKHVEKLSSLSSKPLKPSRAAQLDKLYKSSIEHPGGKRHKPQPGRCAEYGLFLWRQQQREAALHYLQLEMQLYPESKPLITALIQQLQTR